MMDRAAVEASEVARAVLAAAVRMADLVASVVAARRAAAMAEVSAVVVGSMIAAAASMVARLVVEATVAAVADTEDTDWAVVVA